MLVVHRKDGTPHKTELVWNPKSLQNLCPDEWAILCPYCHKAVHWSMKYLSMEWDDFDRISENETVKVSSKQSITIAKRDSYLGDSIESTRNSRLNIFGNECVVCKRHVSDCKLVLHRKDGKDHHRNSTWTREFLQNAIVDEWVMLCNRCHTGVHWFMDNFGVKWDWIELQLNNS